MGLDHERVAAAAARHRHRAAGERRMQHIVAGASECGRCPNLDPVVTWTASGNRKHGRINRHRIPIQGVGLC